MERIYTLELISELMPSSTKLQMRSFLGYYSSFSMAEEAACCLMENGMSSLQKDATLYEVGDNIKQFLQSRLGQISSLEKCNKTLQDLSDLGGLLKIIKNGLVSADTKKFVRDVLGIKQNFEWISVSLEKRMFSITEHPVDEQARVR